MLCHSQFPLLDYLFLHFPISELLHFGNPVNIFGYFDIQIFMKMFPPLQYGQFYKFIFESPGIWNSSTDSTLSKLYDHFVEHKLALSEEDIALAIIILQYQQQCPMKNIKIRMGKFVEILVEYIENYFANSEGKDIDQDKAFVRKTAAIMPLYLKHLKVINKDLESFTDNIKAIYRKYVFYSVIFCQNIYSVEGTTLSYLSFGLLTATRRYLHETDRLCYRIQEATCVRQG